MDNTIFIVIAVTLVALMLPIAIKYVREKYGISEADLKMASDILNISIMVLEELKFEKSDDVVMYAQIVKDGLLYASLIDDNTTTEKISEEACDYTVTQLKKLNIEITDRRLDLIETLINTSVQFYN